MLKSEFSLTEQIYRELKADILSGVFRDQEELRESTLAKKYGVSRTPVRESIRQLAREGLIDTIPNRGAFVRTIHEKDVKDVYAMRSLLEGLGARWAVEHITKKQIDAMEEVLYMSEYYRKKGSWDQVYLCDNRFHHLMYEASGSTILENTLSSFHEYVQQVRRFALKDEARASKSFEEHAEILQAIKNGEAEKAARLATQHIENAVESWKITDAIHVVDL